MQARVTLHLLARLEERQAAENQLRAMCRLRGHSEAVCDELMSAFIEAFNNVVLHAYRDRVDGTVEVVMLLDAQRAIIELSDRGQSFDMQAVPPPPLPLSGPQDHAGLQEGGYGLHIIRSLMSDVSYYQDGGRNVLRMTKEFCSTPV